MYLSTDQLHCREEEEDDGKEHAALLRSGLFSAAIIYSWVYLDSKSQGGILERIRIGCQQAVVCQEDAVEELSRLAMQAASSAAPSAESKSPAEAISLLRLLTLESKLLSAQAASQLEVWVYFQREDWALIKAWMLIWRYNTGGNRLKCTWWLDVHAEDDQIL